MKTKLFKGDATLNAVTLIVAGVVGMLTGTGVAGLSPLGKIGVAILVGLTVGALLHVLLRAWRSHRST
jgi:hypothetical protein